MNFVMKQFDALWCVRIIPHTKFKLDWFIYKVTVWDLLVNTQLKPHIIGQPNPRSTKPLLEGHPNGPCPFRYACPTVKNCQGDMFLSESYEAYRFHVHQTISKHFFMQQIITQQRYLVIMSMKTIKWLRGDFESLQLRLLQEQSMM